VGNLTTVSNSVRDLTTLLLGYWFAERIADERGPGSELATFLKWEQLAAYARAGVNRDFAFRGIERVRRNLSEGPRVTLSDNPAHQILGQPEDLRRASRSYRKLSAHSSSSASNGASSFTKPPSSPQDCHQPAPPSVRRRGC
jgi:hypothetical protein